VEGCRLAMLDFRRSLEERGLLSRTATGDRAYWLASMNLVPGDTPCRKEGSVCRTLGDKRAFCACYWVCSYNVSLITSVALNK